MRSYFASSLPCSSFCMEAGSSREQPCLGYDSPSAQVVGLCNLAASKQGKRSPPVSASTFHDGCTRGGGSRPRKALWYMRVYMSRNLTFSHFTFLSVGASVAQLVRALVL